MNDKDDPLSRAFRNRSHVNRVLNDIPGGVSDEHGFYDDEVYSDIRQAAARWGEKVSDVAQMTIMVPAGIWSFSQFSSFPDLDISTLGIGNHRFFLFHSAAIVWALKKIYDARLARTAESEKTSDKVVDRILGVMAASGAWGVGIHLALDVFQPKSVVFPFIGSPVEGTLVDDNIWLMGNSLYCFHLGNQMFALALGNDLPRVKSFVKEKIIQPVSNGVSDAVLKRNRTTI